MMPSTSRRIAAVARRLLQREGGDAVTMRRVAKAVGLTPMAIYRHYRGRSALLNTLANQGFEELAALLVARPLSGNVEERLIQLLDVYLDHGLRNPRLFELMFLKLRPGARRYPQDFQASRSPTANLLAELVREGMASGYFRKSDVWEIVFAMGALSHGLIMLYLGGRTNMTHSQFRNFYRRSFVRYFQGVRE
jgi:AcrR family transcriptional regulator